MSHLVAPNWARTENTTITDSEIVSGIAGINNGLLDRLSPSGFNAIIWTSIGVCALFLAGRIWVRLSKAGRLHWDDYWMMCAWLFLMLNGVLQTCQMPDIVSLIINTNRLKYYAANGLAMTPEGQMEFFIRGTRFMKYEFTIIGFFWTVLWCVKASFLAFFYTLFEGLPRYRKAWWGVVIFSFLAYVGCWVASINNCHPPKNYFTLGACNKKVDTDATLIIIVYST